MPSSSLDVLALGDAMVDVIADCDDAFIARHGLPKGRMQLLTPAQADALYAAMGQAQEMSGGSAANTMAGLAALGARAGFIGQIGYDQFGRVFNHDMHALGVRFDTRPLKGGPPTGRCLILVTPDKERTMNTCPGASHELEVAAVDMEAVRAARILYLEGYLWGPAKPRAAMEAAVAEAHRAGNKVAFTLSESVCLPERRDAFFALAASGGVDLLFLNEDEACQLMGTSDLDTAIAELMPHLDTLVVTRGAAGAVAVQGETRVAVPAAPVARLVDTTGAGDLFAAGFLARHLDQAPLDQCLKVGAVCAAEVIGHYGARPLADLKALAAAA